METRLELFEIIFKKILLLLLFAYENNLDRKFIPLHGGDYYFVSNTR